MPRSCPGADGDPCPLFQIGDPARPPGHGSSRWRAADAVGIVFTSNLALTDMAIEWTVTAPWVERPKRTVVPDDWLIADPVLGYRPSPGTTILMTATYGNDTLYRISYRIDASGVRMTAPAPAGADTYLFLGDSLVFGEALSDRETLAAQFAHSTGFKVRTVNLGVPGYALNHLVRTIEAGLLASYAEGSVKAVVTWLVPEQLERVTGDAPWLASSPCYVLKNGMPRYVGSFTSHRWRALHIRGMHLVREQFPFLRLVGQKQRRAQQADLYVALLGRLQQLVRQEFNAPLIALYSWPESWLDRLSPPIHGVAELDLAFTLARIRMLGIPLISVNPLVGGSALSSVEIPYNEYPTAKVNRLAARELKAFLQVP